MTASFLEERSVDGDFTLRSDEDATKVLRRYNASDMVPVIAKPHQVDNVVPVTDVEGYHIDQVFIGSVPDNGGTTLKAAAELLKGETVAQGVRMIVIPASRHRVSEGVKNRSYRYLH